MEEKRRSPSGPLQCVNTKMREINPPPHIPRTRIELEGVTPVQEVRKGNKPVSMAVWMVADMRAVCSPAKKILDPMGCEDSNSGCQ